MAKRNYTTEAYEQIKKTIDEIDNTDVHPVKEFFSDLVLRIGQFLEFFTVDQYKEDMQKWYDIVLDSHNSTINEVDNIFKAVGKVDAEYQKIMDDAVSSVTNFRSTLNCLRDIISEKTSLADGKAAANGYLTAGRNSLNAAYGKVLTRMQQRTLWDISKALIGDAIGIGAGYVSLLTKMGDKVAFTVELKKLSDTYAASLCDLMSMVSVVIVLPIGAIGAVSGMDYGTYVDIQADLLTVSQKLKDTNSISDVLGWMSDKMTEELEECPVDNPYYPIIKMRADLYQFLDKGAQTVDLVVDAYGILNDLKDTHDLVYGTYYTKEEYLKVIENKGKILEIIDDYNGPIYRVRDTTPKVVSKIISNWTGLPTSDWNDPAKVTGNGWKTVKTLWSYAEAGLPNPGNGSTGGKDWMDVFAGKIKSVNIVKDVIDFVNDLDNFAHADKTNTLLTS